MSEQGMDQDHKEVGEAQNYEYDEKHQQGSWDGETSADNRPVP